MQKASCDGASCKKATKKNQAILENNMARIKTLLFDFDGTLMNTTNVIIQSWQQVYKAVTGAKGDERVILDTFGSILANALKDAFPEEPTDKLLKIYRDYQYLRLYS